MISKHLYAQIEQIADLAGGRHVDVIVQMESPESFRNFLESSNIAIATRRSVASARDLLPPSADSLAVTRGGHATAAAKGRLRAVPLASKATFQAGFELNPLTPRSLAAAGKRALRPLLNSTWVKEASAAAWQTKTANPRSKSKPQVPDARPAHFVYSGSAMLRMSKDKLRELPKSVPGVADIYPNRTINVPPTSKSLSLPPVVTDNKSNAWGLAKSGALAAWGVFGARGSGAVVAILDTGIDAKHPDLAGKIKNFAEFDDYGRLVTEGEQHAYDSGQHGTHCAGIVVGGQASGRCIGMAPAAKILSGLVLKNGSGTDAQILAGMDWAIRNGADVISMSLGGLRLSADVLDTYTRTIINANRMGIPVVVASGNDGNQTTGSPGNDYFAFTVGATDSEDWAAGFSGGRTQVFLESRYIRRELLPLIYSKPEVSAPGVNVYSSVPRGKWEAWSGTSMATPHVAGAMALLLGRPSKIRNVAGIQRVNLVQSLLTSTVKELGEVGQNHRFGYGRIDALRALGYARELGYFR